MFSVWKKAYGFIGLAIISVMVFIAHRGIAGANIWVTPFAWFGYILFVDWFIYRKAHRSLLITHTREFFIMLPLSVGLWSIFEVHNLLFGNWEYIGLPQNKAVTLLGFVLSFVTILPAIYETFQLLENISLFKVRVRPSTFKRTRLVCEIGLGMFFIGIATFFPSTYTGPLLWPGYLLIFAPLNYLLRFPTILDERKEGKISGMLHLLLAGYICGFFWEFFNYWAGAKWVYHVPYLSHIRIFEMPVLGFLGFGPFAIAFLEMYHFVRSLLKRICCKA